MRTRVMVLNALLFAACGSDGGPDGGLDGSAGDTGAAMVVDGGNDAASGLNDATRAAAAGKTATDNAACKAVAPFYWEVGDVTGARGSGQSGASPPTADTQMQIASASKWIYSAHVVEKRGGTLDANDIPYLNFTSGYVNLLTLCDPTGTIDDCLTGNKGTQDAEAIGKFKYNEGHMQKHASLMGLGAMKVGDFTTEVRSQIGTDVGMFYLRPQPADGVATSAKDYRIFLRKLLVGAPKPLLISGMLGTHKVCTNHTACPNEAISSPIDSAPEEVWHYSIGHWVEDDPTVGDGSYSSAGALGFYPWVNQDRTLYGILARTAQFSELHAGYNSAVCGRLIRKSWVSGVAIP